jgi:protein-tyrosine phosphatase
MPEVLDWQTVADPQGVMRVVVRLLRAARLVALPTETTTTLAASALAPAAVERLHSHAADPTQPLVLAVRGMAEARDWTPHLSPLGQRLARRFWPGPLILACCDGIDQGLLGRLPEPVRQPVCPAGAIHLRSPAHEAVVTLLRNLRGPLLMTETAGPVRAVADLVIDDGPGQYPEGPTVVGVSGQAWNVVRAGAVSEDMLRRHSSCLIVFVCTGNTCRSPLAEALCKKQLADRLGCSIEELPERGFAVLSAGLAATLGCSAADEAVAVAGTFGADLSLHRSSPLSPELAAQADYLVTMTRGHLIALRGHFPRLGCQPRLLSPHGDDVADPIGQHQDVYEACSRQIWGHLETLVTELCGPAPSAPPESPTP